MKLTSTLVGLLLFWPLWVQAELTAADIYPSHAAMTWTSVTNVAPGTGELEIKGLPISLNDNSLRVSLQGVAGAAVNFIKIDLEADSKKVTIAFEVEESGVLTAEVRFKTPDVSWRSEYNARLNSSLSDRPGGEITLQHFGRIKQSTDISWTGVAIRLSASNIGPIMAGSKTGELTDNRIAIAEHIIPVDVELWSAPIVEQRGYYVATGVLGHGIPVLPGKAQLFRDGQIVGYTELPRLMRGNRFAVEFGVDEGFQVQISKTDEGMRPIAASKSSQLYHLKLTNSHVGAAPMRLFNRMPASNEDAQEEIPNARSFVLRPGSTSITISHNVAAR